MSRGQKLLVLAMLAVAGVLVLHTFLASEGWSRRTRAQHDLATLDADIARAQQRATDLRTQIDGLRSRTDVQEHVVRDELGYVRRGDVVVDVGEAAATP